MKLTMTLQHGSKTSEHQLEILPSKSAAHPGAKLAYVLDQRASEADCERISPGVFSILLGGRSYEVRVAAHGGPSGADSGRRMVTVGLRQYLIDVHDPRRRRHAVSATTSMGPQVLVAPMPGRIVKVLAAEGQEIQQGAGLLVIEAMKMQNELRAPRAGRVEEIYVQEGTGVESGARLILLA